MEKRYGGHLATVKYDAVSHIFIAARLTGWRALDEGNAGNKSDRDYPNAQSYQYRSPKLTAQLTRFCP